MTAAQCSPPAIKDLMQVLLSALRHVYMFLRKQQHQYNIYSEDNERGTWPFNAMPAEMPLPLEKPHVAKLPAKQNDMIA